VARIHAEQCIKRAKAKYGSAQRYHANPTPDTDKTGKRRADQGYADNCTNDTIRVSDIHFHFILLNVGSEMFAYRKIAQGRRDEPKRA
jgi:hypothetical protein